MKNNSSILFLNLLKKNIYELIFLRTMVLFKGKKFGNNTIKILSIKLIILRKKKFNLILKKLELTPPEFKKIKNSEI